MAPQDAATSRVASSLAPSATMTSAAPAANAESIAEPILLASFRAAMMTVTGAVKRWMVTSALVNCYILTGGRSERMGQSKTQMFLPRVIAAATPLFEQVVAVQRHGAPVLSIRTIHESAHVDDGPVFGVIRALEDAGGPAFILAVDYPLMTTPALGELRRRFLASSALMSVPVWRGIPQPLCAGYRAEVLPLIRDRVSEGKLDLIGLMKDAAAATFPFDGRELMNVNTPDELAKAERVE